MNGVVECDGCGQHVVSFEADGTYFICLTCALVLNFDDIKAQQVAA